MNADGTIRLVLDHWPPGERISHRGWNDEPWKDRNDPLQKDRSFVDVPAWIVHEVVRIISGCTYADPRDAGL